MPGSLLPFPQCLNLRDVFAATELVPSISSYFGSTHCGVQFLLGYFVLPVERGRSIGNGSTATQQRLDDLVRKTVGCGQLSRLFGRHPTPMLAWPSHRSPARFSVPKRAGLLAGESAQGLPGSRPPFVLPSRGCRRRTASHPARSLAAQAVLRPARSSCPVTCVNFSDAEV